MYKKNISTLYLNINDFESEYKKLKESTYSKCPGCERVNRINPTLYFIECPKCERLYDPKFEKSMER